MKVVAYSIKPFEKAFIAEANQKKHDITLISNPLDIDTTLYAEGKEAVIVFTNDNVSAEVIAQLAEWGIKFIVTLSAGTDHIDKAAIARYGIELACMIAHPNVMLTPHPAYLPKEALQDIADQTIRNLDLWQSGKYAQRIIDK